MLKLELDTKPGGAYARWRKGQGLTLHRRDGSLILKINATYADDRALEVAAKTLTFMLRGQNDTNAATGKPSAPNPVDHSGDSSET